MRRRSRSPPPSSTSRSALLRMGWISTFLSKAVMSGFVLGFAIGIIINQAHSLLRRPGVDGSYMQQLWGLIEEIPDTSGATLVVGAASLGLLLVMRYRSLRSCRGR